MRKIRPAAGILARQKKEAAVSREMVWARVRLSVLEDTLERMEHSSNLNKMSPKARASKEASLAKLRAERQELKKFLGAGGK